MTLLFRKFTVNAECRILDTTPVRTMVCVCIEGYQGNAAIQCDLSEYSHRISIERLNQIRKCGHFN